MNHISSEFIGSELDDKRLNKRLLSIASSVMGSPEKSFPEAFGSSAELEGFYRFVENPYIEIKDILEPHKQATLERMSNKNDDIIIAHDSSEFVFSGKRYDLGTTSLGKSPSFFGHFSLAISASDKEPLGILALHCFKRGEQISPYSLRKNGILTQTQARRLPSEKQRWNDAIDTVSKLSDSAKNAIHVCDSETDSYALLIDLSKKEHRFIIRGCYDRALINGKSLREEFADESSLFSKEIYLSRRNKKSGGANNKRLVKRDARNAIVDIKSKKITLKRSNCVDRKHPLSLDINAVFVLEKNPPRDEKPVEWILLTQEAIDSHHDIEKIIEYYCSRWLIEEYFKVLKTGCSYEKRQLESFHSLKNCLGIFIPISWFLLLLRNKSREPNSEPELYIPKPLLTILRNHSGYPLLTTNDALGQIAKLGGHIKYNGPPGWLVLWRGFRELYAMYKGYKLAESILSTKRYDQS